MLCAQHMPGMQGYLMLRINVCFVANHFRDQLWSVNCRVAIALIKICGEAMWYFAKRARAATILVSAFLIPLEAAAQDRNDPVAVSQNFVAFGNIPFGNVVTFDTPLGLLQCTGGSFALNIPRQCQFLNFGDGYAIAGTPSVALQSIAEAVIEGDQDMLNTFGVDPARNASEIVTMKVSGRLRKSDNDGLNDSANWLGGGGKTHPFESEETSVYASMTYRLPHMVRGGTVRLGFIVGQNDINVDMRPNDILGGVVGGIASGENTSILIGGNVLWGSQSGLYMFGGVVGHFGQSDMINKSGTVERYKNDTGGVIVSSSIGQVTSLGQSKVDLRIGGAFAFLGGNDITGSDYRDPNITAALVSFSPMLFRDITVNGGLLRPYIQGSVKYWILESDVRYKVNGQTVNFDQSNVILKTELGMNYVSGGWTFGIAGYGETSNKTDSIGGRASATYKFDN